MTTLRLTIRGLAAVLLALFGLTADVRAADVPVDVQMPLFVNIWKLDRSFQARRPQVSMAVLYQENNAQSSAARAAVVSWASKTSAARVVSVSMDDAGWEKVLALADVDVFYVTPMRAADIARIAAIARARRIRTMTGTPEYVRQGIAVAIGVRNDRPLIVINLGAARAEGAVYQAQLLKLAEIVDR